MGTSSTSRASRTQRIDLPTPPEVSPEAELTVLTIELPPLEHTTRALPSPAAPEQATTMVQIRCTKKPRERRKPRLSPLARETLALVPVIQGRADEIVSLVDRYRETEDVAFPKAIAVLGKECADTFQSLLQLAKRHERSVELRSLVHDLKNLCAPMIGYAELLADGIPSPKALDRIVDYAVEIKALTARCAAEISGKSANRSVVSIRDVIERVVEKRRPQLERERITLAAVIEDELVTMAPKGDLERVIDNFVLNAAQAMADQDGPRAIAIRATAHDDRIEVRVTDTGPGVAPEILTHLFATAITTKSSGHGIGTLGAAQIIRTLGGDIGADSELGQGADFWFRLPKLK